mmetsp:Transcript_2992/g.4104  ORF Transcript_2992/g.4104 Transcript_2992/m.4104 type:complete len:1856 (-) Transcript_2992:123-5690(-)
MEAFEIMNKQTSTHTNGTSQQKQLPQSHGVETTAPQPSDAPNPTTESYSAFASQFHTDGYLLFRALCKLSAKTLPGEDGTSNPSTHTPNKLLQPFSVTPPAVDPLALKSKTLSLELILAVFEHCGDAFRTGEKFIYAVQNYLCVSLLKNCMSQHTTVAFLSLKIFLLLVYKFKTYLKSEIEVFVANIFLRVLESPNSPYEQKNLVLEALRVLCSDPTMLTQIFLNYDCDFDAVNLYKNIVHNLTKLSAKATRTQSQYGNQPRKDVEQELALGLAGLEVLVMILRAFLKALNLPGGDDVFEEEADAEHRINWGSLKLDVGLAAMMDDKSRNDAVGDDTSVATTPAKGERPGSSEGEQDGVGTEDVKPPSQDSAANKIVDAFERKETQQKNFETGVVKFTLSLKQGLQFFIENGFTKLDAAEIAKFFHEHKDRLDKTQIGEVLGREPDSSFIKVKKGEEAIDPEKGGEGFFVRILHHYVDVMDYTNMEFDDAIRSFLSGFRLPGEAQKIDRIMEKFAERYTRQNEEVFTSADTAFILGFSVIMLNTDLHNPSIKPERRMTLDSFIRNNRGISANGGDLPVDFLTGIYDRIKAMPFTLKEDDDAREKAGDNAQKEFDTSSLFADAAGFFGSSADDRKREKFRKEREEMMAASEQLFRKRPGKAGEKASMAASSQLAESVSPADVVKPMFDVTWGPLIGTLSQVLETSADANSIALCLNGFVYAVRISSHSGMSLARDTFVNSLAKFTTLGSIKEMKSKNIESIRTLLSIAIIDGDYLGESWAPVLQCISQLALLQLYASGLDADSKFLTENEQDDAHADAGGFFRQPTKAETDRELEENNGRAVLAAVNEVLIDKVFSSSVNLSALGIAHFIEQLVSVSESEIAGESKGGISGVTPLHGKQTGLNAGTSSGHGKDGPRIFCLQRLVEVADYNMDFRPRLAWAQMWELMANHFAKIGCHKNAMVSMFAIDALRQLSFKFLEKPELSDFNFQRIFLRPFLLIMENASSRNDIRELILRCVDNMIRALAHNLRSGWKVFFSILTLSASDPSEKINTLGLAILQRLLDEHLDQLCRLDEFNDHGAESKSDENEEQKQLSALQRRQRNANAEDFVELCKASLSFVQTEESEHPLPIGLSMRALCHTACYADLIASKRVLPPVSGCQSEDPAGSGFTYDGLSDVEAEEMVLWRPIFDGLAAGICSPVPSIHGDVGCIVQRGSLMTLRAILLRHGSLFSVSQWVVILKQVILPSIQIAAEYDNSQVTKITSESPSVSSLDFLSDPLPLPPDSEDEGLIKFAMLSQSEESAPTRPLGEAELLVEASFADLRHNGDGNLSRVHGLAKKDADGIISNEQPFPDSWIATTAPIALGLLTDIIGKVIVDLGVSARTVIWPIVIGQFQRWSIGYPLLRPIHERRAEMTQNDGGSRDAQPWFPCEALVRIGCHELGRIPDVVFDASSSLTEQEAIEWPNTLCLSFSDTLTKNVVSAGMAHEELVECKLAALGIPKEKKDTTEKKESTDVKEIVNTPYGKGRVVGKRKDKHVVGGVEKSVNITVVEMESGATMYGPIVQEKKDQKAQKKEKRSSKTTQPKVKEVIKKGKKSNMTSRDYLYHFVRALKIKCVASHCLQQQLPHFMDLAAWKLGKEEVSKMLEALEHSRQMSRKASLDEDLAHAFQEALFSEWGDGVEEVEAALSSMGKFNHRGGSEMFFLTQQAGSNKATIHLLSLLFLNNLRNKESEKLDNAIVKEWDREGHAQPLLLERMMDVLENFLISEEKDGTLIDPNVWRMSSESGGKVAVYCTSFAVVVVEILNTIIMFSTDQFARHKNVIFPVLCSLVKVQSDEIRGLIYTILSKQVAPLIDVSME